MFVYPFMCPHLVRLASLISFIVIYGPLQLLASLVINTIWSFLMIAPIICGLFLYDLNLTLSARSLNSSPTPTLSLAPASKRYCATTGESLTTLVPATSSSPRAFTFPCPALTPRLRTVKLNALFGLSIMLFAPCYFRRPCLPPTGWRLSPRRLSCSTYCPPRL
jgi:hypothetical protein